MDEVIVVEADPRWPEQFAEEAERLRQALGDALVAVEHVGSTAIPGLSAKPVIDILAGVRALGEGEQAVPALEALGYEYRGENGIPGRLFFRKGLVQGRRTHHLHMVETGHEQWASMLAFRDYLRAHPDAAQRYEALKHDLARQFRDDRRAYTEGKTEFVRAVLEKAGVKKKMDEIAIVPYDPRWPKLFAAEAVRVRAALGSDLVVAVEHFGSTAVPGLSAKPIIDILVGVRSVAEARAQAVPAMESLGYAFWYDNPNPPHLFFVKGLPPNGPRTHHIHMVEPGTFRDPKNESFLFWDRLLFRDYLRAHPDEAQRYEAIKRDLASRYPDDREAYTDGKTEYVYGVMQKARNLTPAQAPTLPC